jgi:hypothetical protein
MTCAVAFGIKFPVAEWRETDANIRCAGRVACVVVDVTRGQRVAAELIFLCVMRGIGAGTLDKLKVLAGMTVPPKRVTWKREALRLYALLEQHGIEYVKQK